MRKNVGSVKGKIVGIAFAVLALAFLIFLVIGGKEKEEAPTPVQDNWQEALFDQSLPGGTLEFTFLPADLNDFQYITPLGNMNPPGHTAPTDHIYFVHEWRSAGKPVYAPAGGKILWIQPFKWPDGVEHSVDIGVTKTCTYYIAHLVLDENLKVGDYVQAGQRLGVISRYAAALDLGVMNRNILQPFVNPKRYGYTQLYGDSPLKYFVEPYKSQLYAKVLREGEDKDGKFCYDQRGKLIGTWVEENAPPDPFKVPDWGRYQLSFAYDVYRPTLIRISLGDDFLALPGEPLSLLPAGLYFVQDGAIPPENVTPSSGKVTYYLYGESGGGEFPPVRGERRGLLIVQMLSEDRIKVEAFGDTTSTTREFTSRARIYVR
jgi:hypothetical protein